LTDFANNSQKTTTTAKLNPLIPFHFKVDTFRQAGEQRSRGAEGKEFVSGF
jgi:hypothetical protein